MPNVAIEFNEPDGDIYDREYACGYICANDYLVRESITDLTNAGMPSDGIEVVEVFGIEDDYSIYCAGCGVMLSLGMTLEDYPDCDWSCVPVVIGRVDHPAEEHCEHGQLTKISIPWKVDE